MSIKYTLPVYSNPEIVSADNNTGEWREASDVLEPKLTDYLLLHEPLEKRWTFKCKLCGTIFHSSWGIFYSWPANVKYAHPVCSKT